MKRLSKLLTRTSYVQPSKPVESSTLTGKPSRVQVDPRPRERRRHEKPLPELPTIPSSSDKLFDDLEDDFEPEDYYEYYTLTSPRSVFSADSRISDWTLPLPQDIILEIIDYFYDDPTKPDLKSLFALACTTPCLTCYCRSLIYRTITINHKTRKNEYTPKHLAELLCYYPEVADFVRTLRFHDTGGMFQHSAPFAEDEQCLRYILLRGYPNLMRLEISLPIMWILLPTSLRVAFEICLSSPGLSELSILQGRIPASLLQSLKYVDRLEITALLSYPDQPNPSQQFCIPRTLVLTDVSEDGEALGNVFHEDCPLRLHKLEDLQIHTSAKLLHLAKPVLGRVASSLVALTLHATSLGGKRVPLNHLTKLRNLTLISDLLVNSDFAVVAEHWIIGLLSTVCLPCILEVINIITIYGVNCRSIDDFFSSTALDASWPRLHLVHMKFAMEQWEADEEALRLSMPALVKANLLRISYVDSKAYPMKHKRA